MNALLADALTAFGLTGAPAEFIRHNENMTYRVDGRYLLRIHKAAEGLQVDHSPALRKAEFAFLRHLAAKGLHVQQPVAEAFLPCGTHATLLTWLEGHHYTADAFSADVQRQLGSMLARMQQAARDFHHAGVRRYDAAHARQQADALRQMGERHHLPPHEIDIACRAAETIAQRLAAAESDFIVIHCDLSQSNILCTPKGPAPIDFSLCGLGHPMHDLSVLLSAVRSQAERKAIAEGYIAAGGRIDLPLLDAGFTLGLLEALVIHADKWPLEDWFGPRLTRWCVEQLRPLAEGKAILDENMLLVNIK